MQGSGVDRDFWRDRRVFVTGHTGFLGGWLCLWLYDLGARVTGYALPPPTRPSLFESVGLDDLVTSVIADVRNPDGLSRAVAEADPEVVIHLAAQSLVRRAHAAPVETFASNVMGTVNLLEAARRAPSLAALVVVTSDKVYENMEWEWGYRETDRLGGLEPYGASKACAELAVEAYRHAYFGGARRGAGIATVRAGNIIGGGDWAEDRLIPDLVRAFGDGRTPALRNPDAVRPWQHALDPGNGILMLAERLAADAGSWSGPWNLGPAEDAAQPVSHVAGEVARLWGDGAGWTGAPAGRSQPYEARLLTLNSARAAARLEWRPRWSLERAIAATVEWYRAHIAGDDMRTLSLRQIAAFEGAN